MWNLKNVPKIIHLYWGRNKPLSYLRYLTIKSFIHLNPDWEVHIYYPKHTTKNISWSSGDHKGGNYGGKDKFEDLEVLENVKIFEIDFDELNYLSEVHKSDYIRWRLLTQVGGVWSDFDIFYMKPMNALYINNEKRIISNFDASICIVECDPNYYRHVIGFIVSKKDSTFYKNVSEQARNIVLKKDTRSYQSLGANLLSLFIAENAYSSRYEVDGIYTLKSDVVYPVFATKINELVSNKVNLNITTNTIGIHWFAGNKDITNLLENRVTNKDDLFSNVNQTAFMRSIINNVKEFI